MGQWGARMTSQYDYALDHLKLAVGNSEGSDGSESYSGSHFAVDLFYGAIIVGAYVFGYYYFEPFKNADGFNGDSKFKFEIKKATDVD